MRDVEPHFLRRVVRLALDTFDDCATRVLDPDDVLAIALPGDSGFWYVATGGRSADDPEELTIARGPAGLRYLRTLANHAAVDEALERAVVFHMIELVALHELPPPHRAALQRAGVHLETGDWAPYFSAKEKTRGPRDPDRRDLRLVAKVLEHVRTALDEGAFPSPAAFEAGLIATLRVSEDDRGLHIGHADEAHPDDLGRTVVPVGFSAGSMEWPVEDRSRVLTFADVPGSDGDDGDGDGAPDGRAAADVSAERVLVMADAATGEIEAFCSAPAPAPGIRRAAHDFVRGAWWGYVEEPEHDSFPRELLVGDARLRELIAPALEAVGVTCTHVATHPAIDAALAGFPARWLAAQEAGLADGHDEAEDGDEAEDDYDDVDDLEADDVDESDSEPDSEPAADDHAPDEPAR